MSEMTCHSVMLQGLTRGCNKSLTNCCSSAELTVWWAVCGAYWAKAWSLGVVPQVAECSAGSHGSSSGHVK